MALYIDVAALAKVNEWPAVAREMITRKEYRVLSPSVMHNKAGQIMRLNGAGLGHKPALHLKAANREKWASQETTMDTPPDLRPFLDRLVKVLTLGPAGPRRRGISGRDTPRPWKAA